MCYLHKCSHKQPFGGTTCERFIELYPFDPFVPMEDNESNVSEDRKIPDQQPFPWLQMCFFFKVNPRGEIRRSPPVVVGGDELWTIQFTKSKGFVSHSSIAYHLPPPSMKGDVSRKPSGLASAAAKTSVLLLEGRYLLALKTWRFFRTSVRPSRNLLTCLLLVYRSYPAAYGFKQKI